MVRTYVAQKAPRRHSSTQRRILPRHGGTSAKHDDDVEQRKALVLSRNSQRTLLIRSEGILERLGREALDHFAGRLGLDGHELTERHGLPAGLAFLWRSLIMDTPGIVNLPCFFRASGTSVCKATNTALQSFFLTPALASICANISDCVMARMAFMLFIVFTISSFKCRFSSIDTEGDNYQA